MSEAYLTNWSFRGENRETRNHFHETALREARIATEYRQAGAASPAKASLLTRVRMAFAAPVATDACNCPA